MEIILFTYDAQGGDEIDTIPIFRQQAISSDLQFSFYI